MIRGQSGVLPHVGLRISEPFPSPSLGPAEDTRKLTEFVPDRNLWG
jgi:hypothetical protein